MKTFGDLASLNGGIHKLFSMLSPSNKLYEGSYSIERRDDMIAICPWQGIDENGDGIYGDSYIGKLTVKPTDTMARRICGGGLFSIIFTDPQDALNEANKVLKRKLRMLCQGENEANKILLPMIKEGDYDGSMTFGDLLNGKHETEKMTLATYDTVTKQVSTVTISLHESTDEALFLMLYQHSGGRCIHQREISKKDSSAIMYDSATMFYADIYADPLNCHQTAIKLITKAKMKIKDEMNENLLRVYHMSEKPIGSIA